MRSGEAEQALIARAKAGDRSAYERHLEPAVRPDDVLTGLGAVAGLELVGVPLLTRLAQGPLDEETGEIGDPLRGVK